MTITEILQLVDELIYAQKGKHLDERQEAIIKGVWEDQTYQEIADECNRSESRVRNVASQLWKLLSEKLGEDIDKDNFRYTFNRLNISPSQSLQSICNVGNSGNHNCNFGSQTINQPNQQKQQDNINHQSKSSYYDLTLAPQIIKFYNRESELQTLSSWILNQNIHLISVLGLSGIGKTALVRRFVDLNLEQFEVILWKSFKFSLSLDSLITDLLNTCQQEKKEILQANLKELFDILTRKRCLIILDDVQNIFINGQIAGQYHTEYKDYQKFFKMITEINHQSNLILISQEKCAEMNFLNQPLNLSKCLELSGLNDITILDSTGLNNQDNWSQLIQIYEGNLNYLKDIVSLILDIYDGEVAEFLSENTLIITQNMQTHFQDLFKRLSSIEQHIILELSKFHQPISRDKLNQNLALSSVDFVNGLQSLQQRYLVMKIKSDKITFNLSPAFREYVKNHGKSSC